MIMRARRSSTPDHRSARAHPAGCSNGCRTRFAHTGPKAHHCGINGPSRHSSRGSSSELWISRLTASGSLGVTRDAMETEPGTVTALLSELDGGNHDALAAL